MPLTTACNILELFCEIFVLLSTKIITMKKVFSIALVASFLASTVACAQGDKSKRPSPPATVTETITSGAVVKIDYSKPSVKGRSIGINLEPKEGQVWRTGANDATVFETDKVVTIEGESLPAGKYGLFTLVEGDTWTIIFNKTWKQWGAMGYNKTEDALRVKVKPGKAASFYEQLSFNIDKGGNVSLMWGDIQVNFMVK